MPRFAEALAALGEAFADAPEGSWDDISGAYNDDIAEATTGADAMVGELTAQNETLQAQLLESQADNYKLMKAADASFAAAESESGEESDGDAADETDEYETPAEDFFTEDEDDN